MVTRWDTFFIFKTGKMDLLVLFNLTSQDQRTGRPTEQPACSSSSSEEEEEGQFFQIFQNLLSVGCEFPRFCQDLSEPSSRQKEENCGRSEVEADVLLLRWKLLNCD